MLLLKHFNIPYSVTLRQFLFTVQSFLQKRCPDGWSSYGGKCFIFIDTPKKWTEAEVYCRFDGANLASIHSEEENHFITSLTRGESHNFPQTWLGGFDAIHPGYWMWSDGSEFNYKNWCDNNQDDDEHENHHKQDKSKNKNCLRMNYDCKKRPRLMLLIPNVSFLPCFCNQ
uniref:C-type lectin domain-containing protein n=1 Tax=Anabas testudineus TaxID=64144 RepID=A0A3Q1I481_ANATE